MHRARAYKGSKLGPEKQARQNPKAGFGTGPAVRLYRNRSKRNTGGKCSICPDKERRGYLQRIGLYKYSSFAALHRPH
jgi:hypothetical protein